MTDPTPQTPPSSRRPIRDPGEPLRILLVDDDYRSSWLLGDVLETAMDCEVLTACGGAEAVDAACRLRPHVVVMDVMMPGMDGLDAARVMRRALPLEGVLWIALTGLCSPEDRKRTADAGFAEHLVKPVNCQRLIDILQRATRG